METIERKKHWENIYQTKEFKETSWFQNKPLLSLDLIQKLVTDKHKKIIDIGGGDSYLIDHLIELGYKNLSVLDISSTAIKKAQERLGTAAVHVTWIESDIATFQADTLYDAWHDRAAFHFLTKPDEIQHYIDTVYSALNTNGILILGTFSETGPKKCSGIDIQSYSISEMKKLFQDRFEAIECLNIDHLTPNHKNQNFTFCSFKKRV